MCGLAGFYNLTRPAFIVDRQLLDRMQQTIAHRGPDAAGIWVNDECQLGLASRRLSIIDLSDAGNQPMYDEQKQIVVCFNGEIYNHAAVRRDLEQCGYVYRSMSDTETIINVYHAWGIEGIARLEGMFAIVLFDVRHHRLYLIRDRIGVKPLYFSLQGGVLSFASEIKALWPLPWMQKRPSPLAAYHYMTFMVAPAPWTAFDGVYKLPAGFYAAVDNHKRLSFHEWYNPAAAAVDRSAYADEPACIERIQELLIASTDKRMVSDVPVGAYLSGGIDSSLNVALMSRFSSRIKTFTIAFSDGTDNELAWARRVAKQFGTDHHELVISEAEAFAFYKRMIYHLDEPLADCVCIPFYYVSQLARDAGMKVVQVGEGADELFFGYPSYGRYAQVNRWLWQPGRFLPAFARRQIGGFMQPLLDGHVLRQELLQQWVDGQALFWGGALAFGEQQKRGLFDNTTTYQADPIVEQVYPGMPQVADSHAVVAYHRAQLAKLDPHADFGKQMLYLELKQRLPELLLMRADKMAMAASIEAREPFLDHHLVEFMLNAPAALKFKGNTTKYLLKRAASAFLPHDIIYRTKVGFGAPTARWLEQGKFFPAQLARLAQQYASFTKPESLVHPSVNPNGGHRAVQNWVLQQLWAWEQLL